ncbi:MAG: hypothetical protein LC737_08315, partial [Chloroflexi bacterium]|nr:hypothetical protein [Chloroflexota bacterium]
MEFNVAQLMKERTGATRQYKLDENLDGLDPEIAASEPLVGTVNLMRTIEGVLATGDLRTTL